jgi:hypothetical protein
MLALGAPNQGGAKIFIKRIPRRKFQTKIVLVGALHRGLPRSKELRRSTILKTEKRKKKGRILTAIDKTSEVCAADRSGQRSNRARAATARPTKRI